MGRSPWLQIQELLGSAVASLLPVVPAGDHHFANSDFPVAKGFGETGSLVANFADCLPDSMLYPFDSVLLAAAIKGGILATQAIARTTNRDHPTSTSHMFSYLTWVVMIFGKRSINET